MGTREPSDLGWAGLGPAGVDFGSGVGFPEQIYGTGRVARRQLNLPQSRESRGALVPGKNPDPEQAKPWHLHLPIKADSSAPTVHSSPPGPQAYRDMLKNTV